MGFTPLEGLMMTTRPGDLDAGVVTYLLRETGMSVEEVDRVLNEQSGLLGVSGVSGDVSVLLEEEARGNAEAHTAIGMFCYRASKYIGAYFAVLGNVQAVVFGGGIGEHQPEIRRRICEPLESLGLVVDRARNAALDGVEGRFSAEGSSVEAWVIPSDEERIIARDTYHAVRTGKTGSPGDTDGIRRLREEIR
jgi:acetate kinase